MAQNNRSGQAGKTGGRTKQSRGRDDQAPGGQGRVKDPENDRRLKENR